MIRNPEPNVYEFTCCECGREIVHFGPEPAFALCGHCTFLPGWHEDPEMVRLLEGPVELNKDAN